jgi:lactate dehydrogenase-like 2-hydroxyacid dehydrogenase
LSKPKLLITRVLSPAAIERAQRDYDADLNENDHIMGADELVARSQGKDALLVTLTEKLTPELIAKLPASVRIIATYSVGYDHIDLPAAKARGIAMLLMLGAARRAQEGERLLREKKWGGWQPMQLIGRRLDAKRLGILGLGKIGQATAKRARAFDMEIHYHNRRRLSPTDEQGAIYHATLDSLLSVSDFLSVNAPSTPETRGILNATAFAKLPRGAIVVNTARGDLIDDGDMIAALKSGQVGYAGLDVFKGEPDIHPGYYGLENVFVLPHMGTSAIEARDEMGFAALDNIDAVLAGREGPSLLV